MHNAHGIHVLLEGAVRSAMQAALQSEADCRTAAFSNYG
jgi:hypothetical protein